MNQKRKDVFIVGFALFAMFFGAGNLIFPPSLGVMAGKSWPLALIGFLLTGVGMPLLGIISVSKVGSTLNDLADKVSPTFSKVLGTIIMLAIGPLLAIPRTGATTFEMGIKPLFPSLSPWIVSIIYFSITLFFVLKPSSIVDRIGKILTPALLVTLFFVIYKGIVSPIGTPIDNGLANPFTIGFTEGYQTMDALASIVLAGIVINSLIAKGYQKRQEQIKVTIQAGVIAALGLAAVYGGLMYLGATGSSVFPMDMAKTDLTISITNRILGSVGKISIGIAVSLACLTTAVGLTATVGEFFHHLSKGSFPYKTTVTAITVFSAIVSNFGVNTIVKFSVPLLVTVYPIAILLIVMNLFDQYIPNKAAYTGAVFGALFVSLFDALATLGIEISAVTNIIETFPLARQGFAWITPAIVGSLLMMMLIKKKGITS
ncbi:branched-chain amino acid transport system II carrier protein [Clostridiaceae bacterium 35-E11]